MADVLAFLLSHSLGLLSCESINNQGAGDVCDAG
jgi:hypothetical protein